MAGRIGHKKYEKQAAHETLCRAFSPKPPATPGSQPPSRVPPVSIGSFRLSVLPIRYSDEQGRATAECAQQAGDDQDRAPLLVNAGMQAEVPRHRRLKRAHGEIDRDLDRILHFLIATRRPAKFRGRPFACQAAIKMMKTTRHEAAMIASPATSKRVSFESGSMGIGSGFPDMLPARLVSSSR